MTSSPRDVARDLARLIKGEIEVRDFPWLTDQERRALGALCENLEALNLDERLALCHSLLGHLAARYALVLPEPMSAETFLACVYRACRDAPAPR